MNKGDLPSQFRGPDDSPGFLLWQVANAWQRRQRQALEEMGLTHVQFVLLAGLEWLAGNGQSITQATLARYARVDEMMTSQVIRVLEKRGLVARTSHPTDSRAKCLALTHEGRSLLERATPIVAQADETFFTVDGVSASALLHMLRTIAQASRLSEDGDGRLAGRVVGLS
jgi:DNA-binding MarR family transcriptional regulator